MAKQLVEPYKYSHLVLLFKGHYLIDQNDLYLNAAYNIAIRAGYIDERSFQKLVNVLAEIAFEAVYAEWQLFLDLFAFASNGLKEVIDQLVDPLFSENKEAETARRVFQEQVVRMLGVTIAKSNAYENLGKADGDFYPLAIPRNKYDDEKIDQYKFKEEE